MLVVVSLVSNSDSLKVQPFTPSSQIKPGSDYQQPEETKNMQFHDKVQTLTNRSTAKQGGMMMLVPGGWSYETKVTVVFFLSSLGTIVCLYSCTWKSTPRTPSPMTSCMLGKMASYDWSESNVWSVMSVNQVLARICNHLI